MENFTRDDNKKNIIITLIIFLILILSTIIYVFVTKDAGDLKAADKIESNQDIPMTEVAEFENVVEEGPLEGNKKSNAEDKDDRFTFTINKKIVFKNSSSLGDVKIENPATNKYNFYVEIKIKDKDEIVYKSPILEPNQHITNDYLIIKLDKGSYDGVATIFVLDEQSNDIIAQNDMDVKIIVKRHG